MKKVVAVLVLLFVAFMIYVGSSRLINSHHQYIVRHRDGRHWVLNGEPYGYGWNVGVPLSSGDYYWWKDENGFTVKVRKEDCVVERIENK